MTKEQKIEAYSMLLDGKTYQEVADNFGVSRQYIQQLLPMRRRTISGCYESYIYPNFARYMHENHVSLKRLSEKSGLHAGAIQMFLSGKRSDSQKMIDGLLLATGMTYEFAFAKEVGTSE